MIVHFMVILSQILLLIGLVKTETTGLDLQDQNGDNAEARSSQLSEAPTILTHPSDQVMQIADGSEEVILTCMVRSDHFYGGYLERVDKGPLPNENNKSSIYYDEGTAVVQLNITRAHPNCSGRYRCVAYNNWGIAASRTAQVTITVADAIVIVRQPQNITAAHGNNVTISITAKGHRLKYHWKRTGYNVLPRNAVGQYSPHLHIISVTPASDGKYYCIIKDHWGYMVKSHKAILKVLAFPVITTHPNSHGHITVVEGSDVVLRCEATGEGTLNYQWKNSLQSLPYSNTTTLTVTNLTVSDSGEYYCVVDNGGTGVPSMKVQVTAKVKPIITSYPQNQDLSIITGTEKMVLLWEFKGDDVNDVTCQRENGGIQVTIFRDLRILANHNFELILHKIRPFDSGEYSCVVYSLWGVAQSKRIKVNTRIAPPNITMQPTSKTISVLEDVTLTCKAEGFNVKYKWRHNGTTHSANISQSGLTITQVVPSDAGHYVCIASTEGGKDVSQRVMLTVNTPQLTPSNLTVAEGSNVHFNCCIDSPEVAWHIEKQGVTNTIVSSPLMDLYNVSEADSGHYQCSINTRGEEITSNQATIAVFGLIEQLNDKIVPMGSDVVLRCSASVSTAVNCTWKHNNISIRHRDHLSLKLHNVSLTDEGSYTCEMMGNAGKPVTSTAKLEILYVDIDPQDHTATLGSRVKFTCSPSISSSSLTYQWLHNGTRMERKSEEVLTITNVKIADGGTYQCVVVVDTNTFARSDNVQLNIINSYKPDAISTRNSSSTNQNTKFISGAVIALTCVVLAACCCCCCCCQHCRKTFKFPDTPGDDMRIEVSTSGDQSIMEIINILQPKMEKQLNIDELLAYLLRYHVLTNNEEQHLGPNSSKTSLEKARYLLSDSVLGSKGPEGENNFVKALYESSKEPGNTGHQDLVIQLRNNGVVITEY